MEGCFEGSSLALRALLMRVRTGVGVLGCAQGWGWGRGWARGFVRFLWGLWGKGLRAVCVSSGALALAHWVAWQGPAYASKEPHHRRCWGGHG